MAEDVGHRTRTALGWQVIGQFINVIIHIATSVVLARLLMPEDFGIVGMAAVVVGMAAVFRDLGFGQSLVQYPDLQPRHIASAFWASLCMGVLLYSLLYFTAPYAADYFHDPRILSVVRVISLTFLISPIGTIPRCLLQRELDLRRIFFADLINHTVYGAVGIGTALTGSGYWSLVWAVLLGWTAGSIGVCIIARFRPPLVPQVRGLADLYHFGLGITGINVFGYIGSQVDYLVIGRRLDAGPLGLYKRAFDLSSLPTVHISAILYPVLFPAFSRMSDDLARIRAAYGRVISYLSAVTWAPMVLMVITAPEFIPLIFGEQWTGSVASFQVLGMVGLLRVLGYPAGAAIKSQGAAFAYREALRHAIFAAGVAVAAWYGCTWGIEGVAVGVALMHVGWFFAMAHLVTQATGFGLGHYLRALRGIGVAAVLAAAVAIPVRFGAMAGNVPDWLTLALTLVTGGAAALAALLLLQYPEVKTVRAETLHLRQIALTRLRGAEDPQSPLDENSD